MSNKLIIEKSPYLRDHAFQPIDWYPWCAEAFEKAKREEKPIFLSIGYSTCHWCHVMAQESFCDERVADVLNRSFVAIKVDREERPDIDSVYLRVCSALNGSAGWPMSILMDAEQRPFYAATYLPRESRDGKTGLLPLLHAVEQQWRTNRSVLLKTGQEIAAFVSQKESVLSAKPDASILAAAAKQFKDSYDKEYGGFGTAPKFPSPHALLYLMRYAYAAKDHECRAIADHCLQQMYRGGIYDALGGGFSRYSTDREWLVPHFEKTLYDNALLAYVYAEAYESGRLALYRRVCEDTLDYCLRSLRAENGGFFCGQDADSNGVEGAYYTFTPEEVKSVLGEEDGQHFCECYDITPEGNYNGRSIPNLLLNQRWNLVGERYDESREKLRIAREERALRTDIKELTAWNGMMLMALAKAARVFRDARYLAAAKETAAFLASMGTPETLKARCCGSDRRFAASLSDYAFYALGLIELYRADYDASHLALACELAEVMLREFAEENGALYSTARQAETLLFRPLEVYDSALPSGMSAAAVVLQELSAFTGNRKYRERGEQLLGYICRSAKKYPAGCCFALLALQPALVPGKEIVCACAGETRPAALAALTGIYSPELTLLIKTPSNAALLAELAPFTAQMGAEGKNLVYICENGVCQTPVEI